MRSAVGFLGYSQKSRVLVSFTGGGEGSYLKSAQREGPGRWGRVPITGVAGGVMP